MSQNLYASGEIFYDKSGVTLWKGDCLDTLRSGKVAPPDLIITSPPYNIDIGYNSVNDKVPYSQYLGFIEDVLYRLFVASKLDTRLALNVPIDVSKNGNYPVGMDICTRAQKAGWKYKSTIVWNKRMTTRRNAWGSFKSASSPMLYAPCEFINIFYKEQWKKERRGKDDITKEEFMEYAYAYWEFNGEHRARNSHPAPFPVQLPYRLIKFLSYKGDVILDPFAGSGTTLLVARKLERLAVGIEIDEKYCEMIKARIENDFGLFA